MERNVHGKKEKKKTYGKENMHNKSARHVSVLAAFDEPLQR
jgi:hypothetical protein